jgi:hypothetical protein
VGFFRADARMLFGKERPMSVRFASIRVTMTVLALAIAALSPPLARADPRADRESRARLISVYAAGAKIWAVAAEHGYLPRNPMGPVARRPDPPTDDCECYEYPYKPGDPEYNAAHAICYDVECEILGFCCDGCKGDEGCELGCLQDYVENLVLCVNGTD